MNHKLDRKEPANQKKRRRDGNKSSLSAGENSGSSFRELIIVGIGASAGGLDALQKMLPELPVQEDMAYVVAQHLAPKYRSMLGSLLSKHTDLPIEIVRDGMSVRPDTIYITPPNKDVSLVKNRLKLNDASLIGPKPSIDYFFTSLAEEKGPRAVGIVLSGTGTDGAHGIRAIKSNDGITIAQTAESAKFDGMPNAAIQTGSVDLILPPERIGPELENALKYPHLVAKEPAKDSHLDEISEILELLCDRTGDDFSGYKSSTMYRRISRRMVLHKMHSLSEYLQHAKQNPEELDTLYKDLLISVTSFFRDSKAFEALSRALQEKLETKRPNDAIRVWVPGCSSGEEAYSIAIILSEILGRDVKKYRIQIFATDIDEDSVQRARKGIYPLATVMDTDGRRFERYFTQGENTVTIKKELRDMVVLARQNLLRDTPFLHLDLISCRNLLIYLGNDLQDKILSLFHFSLDPGGLLFLGKSESINKKLDLFSAVDSKWKIFKRKETLINRMPHLIQKSSGRQTPIPPVKVQRQEKKELWKEREFASSLLNVLNCSAVLTDEQGNIDYIRGDVSSYLRLPEGNVQENLNAVGMARQEIRFVLQSLLHRARKENKVVTGQEVKLRDNGDPVTVRVQAGPVGSSAEPHFLIAFVKVAERKGLNGQEPSAPEERDEGRVAELEHELAAAREHLQDTVEELETSSEELQSLNEELQSANEELQASNEELETGNEELQASNEELNTVNEELRVKSDELASALEELEDSEKKHRLLVDNMNEALMLCQLAYGEERRPEDLIIRQANGAFQDLTGTDLHDLPLRAGQANMPELAEAKILDKFSRILKTGKPASLELRLEAMEKELALSAYRLDKDRLGVVCHDETQRKKSEAALKESERKARKRLAELEAIYESAPIGLCVFGEDLRYVRINKHLAAINGVPASDHIGRTVREVVPDLADQAEKVQQQILKTGEPVHDLEFIGKTPKEPDSERIWVEHWLPLKDEEDRVVAINVVAQEITESRKLQEELARYTETLESMVRNRTAELEETVRSLKKEAEERRYAEAKLEKLSKVFMDSNDPIIIEDMEHNITDMNRAAERLYGFSREELIGKPVISLIPEHRRDKAITLRRRCVKEDSVHDWEGLRQDRNGKTHPVLISAFVLRGPDHRPQSIATIAKDISQIKELQSEIQQRARQLARLTNELTLAEQRERHRLAKTLHDHLQQLLAGAKFKLEIIAEDKSLSEKPEIASARDLIQESLETSRSLAAELSPPVLFQQGLVHALRWLARQMKKNHHLKVEIQADDNVEPDQEEIKILLFESVRELLFNVVKHAGQSRAKVELSLENQMVKIAVSDKGDGFDKEKFQDPGSYELGGFGLFHIRERLQLLGGFFELKSSDGNGTTVTLTSPLKSSNFAEPEPRTEQIGEEAPSDFGATGTSSASTGKIRVLLVDDHAVMRDGLSAMLSRHRQIEIAGEASDGEEAVAMARKLRPDVVLMDINMPKMNGIEATGIITSELEGVRVIGLSMHEAEDQADLIKEAGAVAYQHKAGGSAELLKAILQDYEKKPRP